MLQNLSTSFQEHLAGNGRERKGKAGPQPSTKKPSEEKTKSYVEAAAGRDLETSPKKNKKNKGKYKVEEGPTLLKPPNVKQAKGTESVQGKLFATRVTSKLLTNTTADEAKISVALSKTLLGYVCKAPIVLQVSSNRLNGTVTVTVVQGSDSGQYSRYFNKLTDTLNEFVTEGELAFLPFRRVPTDVNNLIHGIPLDAIPTDHAKLDTKIKQHFKDSYKIDQTSAKFLKEDPKSREGHPPGGIHGKDYRIPGDVAYDHVNKMHEVLEIQPPED
ncbi:hypothetical protein HOY80DRAFT_1047279 [Tuber brumale]|nr:hypothetical protein HOY80DRAFT_1047279 [Tuber brumale]